MAKKLGIILIIIAAIFVIGVGIASQNSEKTKTTDSSSMQPDVKSKEASSSSQPAETNSVEISDFEYAPSKIRVKVGTTVTWTNQDNVKHDVAPDAPSDDFKPSKLLAKGESYSYTFTKAGMYNYHCTPHPYMKASVEVVE